MSGWALFLAAFCVVEIVGTPFYVGKERAPITPGAAVLLVAVQLLKLYAILRLAGVL